MKKEKDEVLGYFDELRESDPEYAEYSKTWGALASFLNDYELLKGLNKLTQAEIAKKCATTQSAISRLERMKGKPTYELLRRLSTAVGGELFVTPLADVTVTLPYDLHDKAREKAKEQGVETQDLMNDILRKGIESANANSTQFTITLEMRQGSIEMHQSYAGEADAMVPLNIQPRLYQELGIAS